MQVISALIKLSAAGDAAAANCLDTFEDLPTMTDAELVSLYDSHGPDFATVQSLAAFATAAE